MTAENLTPSSCPKCQRLLPEGESVCPVCEAAKTSEVPPPGPKPAAITQEGTLLMLLYAEGSKSESFRPFLVVNAATVHRLHREGDNPFGASTLAAYHGKYVSIEGRWDPRGKFLFVDRLTEMENPWKT